MVKLFIGSLIIFYVALLIVGFFAIIAIEFLQSTKKPPMKDAFRRICWTTIIGLSIACIVGVSWLFFYWINYEK